MSVSIRLKTEFNSYASFHISVTENEFPPIKTLVFDLVIAQFPHFFFWQSYASPDIYPLYT
jgi:hypothetical protein